MQSLNRDNLKQIFLSRLKGGAGSGNFGHSGIPGHHGGSAPKSSVSAMRNPNYGLYRGDIKRYDKFSDIYDPTGGDDLSTGYWIDKDGKIIADENVERSYHTIITAKLVVDGELNASPEEKINSEKALTNPWPENKEVEEISLREDWLKIRYSRRAADSYFSKKEHVTVICKEGDSRTLKRVQRMVDEGKIPYVDSYHFGNADFQLEFPAEFFMGFSKARKNPVTGDIELKEMALKGGTGSGNFGHAGIPGHHGGSAPRSGISAGRYGFYQTSLKKYDKFSNIHDPTNGGKFTTGYWIDGDGKLIGDDESEFSYHTIITAKLVVDGELKASADEEKESFLALNNPLPENSKVEAISLRENWLKVRYKRFSSASRGPQTYVDIVFRDGDTRTLKRIQKMVDEEKIPYVDGSYALSVQGQREFYFTANELMSANSMRWNVTFGQLTLKEYDTITVKDRLFYPDKKLDGIYSKVWDSIELLFGELRGRTISPGLWQEGMKKIISNGMYAAFMLGADRDTLKPTELLWVDEEIRKQNAYLAKFAELIESSLKNEALQKMFGENEINTQWQAWHARSLLYATCIVHVYWRGVSGVDLPSYPGNGDCDKFTYCGSRIEREDLGEGDWNLYWRGSDCDICKKKAQEWNPLRVRNGQIVYSPELPVLPDLKAIVKERLKGGAGSGNFGHAGIVGHRGGSAPRDGVNSFVNTNLYEDFFPYDREKKVDLKNVVRIARMSGSDMVEFVDVGTYRHGKKILKEIEDWCQRLPDGCLSTIDRILVCESNETFNLIGDCSDMYSAFTHFNSESGESRIYLRPDNSNANKINFYHEVGHCVYGSSKNRENWNSAYKNRNFDRFTEYSKSNAEEGFCETFKSFISSNGKVQSMSAFMYPIQKKMYKAFKIVGQVINGLYPERSSSFKGGAGSGNFGHSGIRGHHGGSAPRSGASAGMSNVIVAQTPEQLMKKGVNFRPLVGLPYFLMKDGTLVSSDSPNAYHSEIAKEFVKENQDMFSGLESRGASKFPEEKMLEIGSLRIALGDGTVFVESKNVGQSLLRRIRNAYEDGKFGLKKIKTFIVQDSKSMEHGEFDFEEFMNASDIILSATGSMSGRYKLKENKHEIRKNQ